MRPMGRRQQREDQVFYFDFECLVQLYAVAYMMPYCVNNKDSFQFRKLLKKHQEHLQRNIQVHLFLV